MLEDAFTPKDASPIPGHITFPVSYSETDLRAIYTAIVDRLIPLISAPTGRPMSADAKQEYLADLSLSLAIQVFWAGLYFKHPAYENEQEYRFIQLYPADKPIDNLRFRSRPYSLLRYREFDWKTVAPETLKEIVVGPAADRPIALRFVHDCLRAYFPTATPRISASEIPYRSSS